jgi:hypothetical protein
MERGYSGNGVFCCVLCVGCNTVSSSSSREKSTGNEGVCKIMKNYKFVETFKKGIIV